VVIERIVVGLGNPGPEYDWTRHNVGFQVLDKLAARCGAIFASASRLEGYAGKKCFEWCLRKQALLAKPTTWMNLSGEAVSALLRHGGLPSESVMVVYDDFDLDLGKLRIRAHGGPGTHNGMRSIVTGLGTDRFPRLRVGIGPPPTDAARHVLARFSERERVEVEISIVEASEAIEAWLDGEPLERVMTRFHSRWN
jgi:PTH1 family peptidyl-tRNA hydrolase